MNLGGRREKSGTLTLEACTGDESIFGGEKGKDQVEKGGRVERRSLMLWCFLLDREENGPLKVQ